MAILNNLVCRLTTPPYSFITFNYFFVKALNLKVAGDKILIFLFRFLAVTFNAWEPLNNLGNFLLT